MSKGNHMAVKVPKRKIKAYRSIDYSGFFERLFARCIDLLITAAVGYLLYRLFGLVTAVLIAFLFGLAVRIITTYYWGGTFGKLLFGVRVVSRCTIRLLLLQVVIRELFRYVSLLFLFLGYFTVIFNRRKKAWHDMAACTAVISGGRDEAQHAREIYTERPEKWNKVLWGSITGILTAAFIVIINTGSNYLLHDMGMIGFPLVAAFPDHELSYTVPAFDSGYIKDIIQIGDVNGDGKYETFREGAEDGAIFIRNVRLSSILPVDGNTLLSFDKPILQYKLLDMDNDKKDEIAVLFEDKTLKVYKTGDETVEMGTIGPLGYQSITGVIKGKLSKNEPYSLYILGDNNRMTIITISDGKLEPKEFELPGSYKLMSFDMGTLGGKRYIVCTVEDGSVVLYNYNGSSYELENILKTPIAGKVSVLVRDMNSDGKAEIILWSPENAERPYPVIGAYYISGNRLDMVWDGGRTYTYKDEKYALSIDEALDVNDDGSLELYMTSRKISGNEGKYSIFVFANDSMLLILNDFLRVLNLPSIR